MEDHVNPQAGASSRPPSPPGGGRPGITFAVILAIALVGGFFVLLGYRSLLIEQARLRNQQNVLPMITRLENDLGAIERSGARVHLHDLKGKVLVAGHVYTRCPRGCSGLAAIMQKLQEKFGSDPNLHLLSFSVDPEHDDAAQLAAFAEAHGVSGDNWWFLTDPADPEAIRDYLTEQFLFSAVREIPEEERLNEYDLFEHDMRLALVDHEGRIRGYYDVISPNHGEVLFEKLERDLGQLLEEAGAAGPRRLPFAAWIIWGALGGAAILFVVGVARRVRGSRGRTEDGRGGTPATVTGRTT